MLGYLELLKLIPVIEQVAHAVETLMPNSPGVQKLAAARELLKPAVADIEAVWPQLSGIVTSVVAILNMLGVLKKPAVAPTA